MSHLRTLSIPAMVQSVRYLEAQKTSGQSLTADTWQKLTYDSPSVNTAGITIASNVFTFALAGLYLIQFGFTVGAGSYSSTRYLKNSGADPGDNSNSGQYVGSVPLVKGPACRFNKILSLAAGDTLQFDGVDQAGVTIAVDTASRLRIIKL